MNIFSSFKPFAVKYKPEILMVMGISGMIFSTIWGIKATKTAVRKIDICKQKLKKNKLTIKEVIKETWKLYLPVVISTVISVPCIIVGNRVSNSRNMALAAAYTISEKALDEYREKTREVLGDKKFNKLQEELSSNKVKNTYPNLKDNVTLIGDGDCLFYEEFSGRYFKTNWNKISRAANELNAKALSDLSGVIMLNDWFGILGLDNTVLGDELGWTVTDGKEGIIDISIDSVLTPDNIPCGAIRYNTMPKKV